MGVMLLVLMPVPYVDASAARRFRQARQCWWRGRLADRAFSRRPGDVRLACVEPGRCARWLQRRRDRRRSTLLFNANPLLRFDGYYVFSDWLEIPNLGQRSLAQLGYLVRRYAFGLRDLQSPAQSPGEARWLLAYGIASFAYRISVIFSIILLVASKYFFAGVLLALWGAAVMIVRPLALGARYLAASPGLPEIGGRLSPRRWPHWRSPRSSCS